MQYFSLQDQSLLPSPVTCTTRCCFCFLCVSSFFLELVLRWSPVVYWAPTDLGSSSFSVLSFCLFILQRWTQKYKSQSLIGRRIQRNIIKVSLSRVSWTARRSNQSILKEISPEYSLERLMPKLKLQFLATWLEKLTYWKRLWCWERLKAGGKGDNRGWDGWMASLTQQTRVWALWELVMDRGAWHAAVHGVTKSWTWLRDRTELNPFCFKVLSGQPCTTNLQTAVLPVPDLVFLHSEPYSQESLILKSLWFLNHWSFIQNRI